MYAPYSIEPLRPLGGHPRGLGQNGHPPGGVDLTLIYNVDPDPRGGVPVPGVVGPSIVYGANGSGGGSAIVRDVRPVTSRPASSSPRGLGSPWLALAFLVGLAGVVGGSRKKG